MPYGVFGSCDSLSELRFVGGTTAPATDVTSFFAAKNGGTVYYPFGATGYNASALNLPSGWVFIAE